MLAPAAAEHEPWEFATVCDQHLVLRLLDDLTRLLTLCAADPLPAQFEELHAALLMCAVLLVVWLLSSEATDLPLENCCGRPHGQALRQPSLAVLGAREGVLRKPAAYVEVQALETEEGPSLGHECLVSLEVDSERVPALGYEGVAGELRRDRGRSAGLGVALDSSRDSSYGLGLQDRKAADGRLAGPGQVGLVDSCFGGPERSVRAWGSNRPYEHRLGQL